MAARVDLSDDEARRFLDQTVTLASMNGRGSTLWPYDKGSVGDWKKSPSWAGIRQNQVTLSCILEATQGQQLRHKRFLGQVVAWCAEKGLRIAASDVEKAVYRLRLMMAHLRDFARSSRKLPKHYGPLATLLDAVHRGAAKAENEMAGEIDDEEEQGEEQSEKGEEEDNSVVTPSAEGENSLVASAVVAPPADLVVISSAGEEDPLEEVSARSDISSVDIDELSERLFRKRTGSRIKVKSSAASPTTTPAKRQKKEVGALVDEDELDDLLKMADKVFAPAPRELVKRNKSARLVKKKKMKKSTRPAQTAADGDSIVDIFNDEWMRRAREYILRQNPMGVKDWRVMRKRVHSKGWHEARLVNKQTATAAGAKLVDLWMQHYSIEA